MIGNIIVLPLALIAVKVIRDHSTVEALLLEIEDEEEITTAQETSLHRFQCVRTKQRAVNTVDNSITPCMFSGGVKGRALKKRHAMLALQ